jgi:hypothetical protein
MGNRNGQLKIEQLIEKKLENTKSNMSILSHTEHKGKNQQKEK